MLKGLLNSGDADALAAAIAEQQFLAQVEHPLIVEIYNFVTHEDAGYIVMEYVGGRSLKQILKERMRANNGAYDPLPVDQALAYILEILPAFQYLHDLGLVYCDFKPDNLIQVGDALKLIDLGGVRRVDDQESAIYGTVGYQAPEVAEVGAERRLRHLHDRPHPRGAVHGVPRLPGARTSHSLPAAGVDAAVPRARLALPPDRQVLRARPGRPVRSRPTSCAIQLLGVLREVVAAKRAGTALTSAASLLFETPAVTTRRARLGPAARPARRHVRRPARLADQPRRRRAATKRLEQLEKAPEETAEVAAGAPQAALEAGDTELALDAVRRDCSPTDPWEWRALWIDGLAALQQQRLGRRAQSAFNAVYQQVPGELAPKLALALACEKGGLPEVAEGLYSTCAATDAAYVAPAAFGMARIRADSGDTDGRRRGPRPGAADQPRLPGESRQLRAEVLLRRRGRRPDAAECQAMISVDGAADGALRPGQAVRSRILGHALEVVASERDRDTVRIGSYEAKEPSLRDGPGGELPACSPARRRTGTTQVRLVDQANAVRNWTLT